MKPADEIAFVDFARGARPRMRRTGGEHAYSRRAVISALLDSTRKRSSKEFAQTIARVP